MTKKQLEMMKMKMMVEYCVAATLYFFELKQQLLQHLVQQLVQPLEDSFDVVVSNGLLHRLVPMWKADQMELDQLMVLMAVVELKG